MASGLADTSAVIDWDVPGVLEAMPDDIAVSALTLAELAAGPHLSGDPAERARRQVRLQQAESAFDPIEFDRAAARSFGLIVAAVTASGRSHRSRIVDLLIAATAHANDLELYTRNPDDFAGLESLISIRGL